MRTAAAIAIVAGLAINQAPAQWAELPIDLADPWPDRIEAINELLAACQERKSILPSGSAYIYTQSYWTHATTYPYSLQGPYTANNEVIPGPSSENAVAVAMGTLDDWLRDTLGGLPDGRNWIDPRAAGDTWLANHMATDTGTPRLEWNATVGEWIETDGYPTEWPALRQIFTHDVDLVDNSDEFPHVYYSTPYETLLTNGTGKFTPDYWLTVCYTSSLQATASRAYGYRVGDTRTKNVTGHVTDTWRVTEARIPILAPERAFPTNGITMGYFRAVPWPYHNSAAGSYPEYVTVTGPTNGAAGRYAYKDVVEWTDTAAPEAAYQDVTNAWPRYKHEDTNIAQAIFLAGYKGQSFWLFADMDTPNIDDSPEVYYGPTDYYGGSEFDPWGDTSTGPELEHPHGYATHYLLEQEGEIAPNGYITLSVPQATALWSNELCWVFQEGTPVIQDRQEENHDFIDRTWVPFDQLRPPTITIEPADTNATEIAHALTGISAGQINWSMQDPPSVDLGTDTAHPPDFSYSSNLTLTVTTAGAAAGTVATENIVGAYEIPGRVFWDSPAVEYLGKYPATNTPGFGDVIRVAWTNPTPIYGWYYSPSLVATPKRFPPLYPEALNARKELVSMLTVYGWHTACPSIAQQWEAETYGCTTGTDTDPPDICPPPGTWGNDSYTTLSGTHTMDGEQSGFRIVHNIEKNQLCNEDYIPYDPNAWRWDRQIYYYLKNTRDRPAERLDYVTEAAFLAKLDNAKSYRRIEPHGSLNDAYEAYAVTAGLTDPWDNGPDYYEPFDTLTSGTYESATYLMGTEWNESQLGAPTVDEEIDADCGTGWGFSSGTDPVGAGDGNCTTDLDGLCGSIGGSAPDTRCYTAWTPLEADTWDASIIHYRTIARLSFTWE